MEKPLVNRIAVSGMEDQGGNNQPWDLTKFNKSPRLALMCAQLYPRTYNHGGWVRSDTNRTLFPSNFHPESHDP